MLEIGYGSGVFMPELASRCEEFHGIDIQDKGTAVLRSLDIFDVTAHPLTSRVEAMPFLPPSLSSTISKP
jgi:hypothetical protein